MSRLTDLIAQAKAKVPDLGKELEREFKALASRRAFGLNFERHRPESVELPGRPVRKGDKVRVLPPRGETKKGDQRLWRVRSLSGKGADRQAEVELIGEAEAETQSVPVADLVVVAEFRDYIYPGLVSTGKVERGGDKPYHTVINGENFHALEALTFMHRGKIDVIYIDPPYNTGAKDWKYNNDYVEGDDLYRHSKWLAFMERRLKVAKELLNPDKSCLIVTIDEKEYLRLGLLLEQSFPDATIQMVTSLIKPSGSQRVGEFSRVEEYLFFVMLGSAGPVSHTSDMLLDAQSKGPVVSDVTWHGLRRRGSTDWRRSTRPNGFFPLYVDDKTGALHSVGEPLPLDADRRLHVPPDGTFCVWPLDPNGEDGRWQISPDRLRKQLSDGTAALRSADKQSGSGSVVYLKSGDISRIEKGQVQVIGRFDDGRVKTQAGDQAVRRAKTMWTLGSHDASAHGTALLTRFIGDRKFPFPKSLYAVEDALRFFVADNKHALVLDFFSGSGTTAHAVMRLNRQDGGSRQSISVTNNEVAAGEHTALRQKKLRPGDPNWEKWGICDYITKPRIEAAITGKTPDGEPIKGDYKFTDEFPMSEGFEENAEFFTLTYETPVAVSHNRAFGRIAPLLWMKAGSEGRRIDKQPPNGWEVVDTYGLLTDLDQAAPFAEAAASKEGIRMAFIVTDDDRRFQSVAQRLPDTVEPVRLYESYLTNFRFSMGR
jgi:adenine-specific DNA-methyltransferase